MLRLQIFNRLLRRLQGEIIGCDHEPYALQRTARNALPELLERAQRRQSEPLDAGHLRWFGVSSSVLGGIYCRVNGQDVRLPHLTVLRISDFSGGNVTAISYAEQQCGDCKAELDEFQRLLFFGVIITKEASHC